MVPGSQMVPGLQMAPGLQMVPGSWPKWSANDLRVKPVLAKMFPGPNDPNGPPLVKNMVLLRNGRQNPEYGETRDPNGFSRFLEVFGRARVPQNPTKP